MTRIVSAFSILIFSLIGLIGCDPSECIRQSDCPEGYMCNEYLMCVPKDAPPDLLVVIDMSTTAMEDMSVVPGDMVDMSIDPCLKVLRCLVFVSVNDRLTCVEKLDPAGKKAEEDALKCGIQACGIICATKISDVELADPNACWNCMVTKIGNICPSPKCE